jgi:hypothetical protein
VNASKKRPSLLSGDDVALALAHFDRLPQDRYRVGITTTKAQDLGLRHKHLATHEEVVGVVGKLDGLAGKAIGGLVITLRREELRFHGAPACL